MFLLQIATVVLAVVTTASAREPDCIFLTTLACVSKVLPTSYENITTTERCCMLSAFEDCPQHDSETCPTILPQISEIMNAISAGLECRDYKSLSKACGLSRGTIAGIVIGCVFAVVIVGYFIRTCMKC